MMKRKSVIDHESLIYPLNSTMIIRDIQYANPSVPSCTCIADISHGIVNANSLIVTAMKPLLQEKPLPVII